MGDLRAKKGRPYARAAAALDAAVAEEKRIADWTAVPETGAAEATFAAKNAERANENEKKNPPAAPRRERERSPFGREAVRDVLEVVSAAFLNWAGADERTQDDVDAALEAALEETRRGKPPRASARGRRRRRRRKRRRRKKLRLGSANRRAAIRLRLRKGRRFWWRSAAASGS